VADCSQNGTCTCGCCSGIAVETPQLVSNRPGLKAIAYRVGDHQQFKDTLLARLHSSHQLALDGLRTREDDDFSIALLDAFSTVADVLTFYTERIANEAYLRTATERASILDLAELIGYQLRPGVAASTVLVFTLEENASAFGTALAGPTVTQVLPQAPPTILINVGTKVQSVPGPGEKPQTFETVEAISARGEWNAIVPLPAQPQRVTTGSRSLLLSGSLSTLKAGDMVLVIGEQGKQVLKRIASVTINPGNKTLTTLGTDSSTTEIDFEELSPGEAGYTPTQFSPQAQAEGAISDFQPSTPLSSEVAKKIISRKWDADILLALAQIQKWDLDQLSANLNQVLEAMQSPQGQAFVFEQTANCFGYNAPLWDSLPVTMRYTTIAQNSSPPNQVVDPPFPFSWEDFTVEDVSDSSDFIFLDKTYSEAVPKSWIALYLKKPGQQQPHTEIRQVVSNSEVAHTDFTISGKVSLLGLNAGPSGSKSQKESNLAGLKAEARLARRINPPQKGLSSFPMRNTVIYCQSEPLPLAPAPIIDDISGKTITLDRAYIGLQAGRKVVVSGERSDADSITVAEIRTLDTVTLEHGFTVITLDKSLSYTYKRPTVSINANVAESTHGETVQEILGSGDGTQTFQSFTLKQSPLTYISADTPSGAKSTLQVRVNDLLWEEVPYFFGHGPDEHIYITRQDDNAVTTVTFGDGMTGSRLPTGQQNVTATYRQGIGSAGLLRPNQISLMLSRPLGVRGSTNPLAPDGAADPEQLDQARSNATLTIMSLDRVVSLADYESFARAFAGIAKALATWTWSGQQRIVLLTVAGVAGATVDPESLLYQNLQNAISKSSEPFVPLVLNSYEPVFFKIGGTVTVAPDFLKSDVAAAVEAALRTTFSFDARNFGQPVHRSEVIAAIQAVQGVQFIDLTQFYRSGDSPNLQDDLIAAVPRPGKNEFFAAQLLTLDPAPLGLEVTQ